MGFDRRLTRRNFLERTASAAISAYAWMAAPTFAASQSLPRAGRLTELDASRPGGIDLILERRPVLVGGREGWPITCNGSFPGRWMQNGAAAVSHGWTPEKGFLRYRWHGYDEALIVYLLGLGSPTHPLPPESYPAWVSTYKWRTIYNIEFLYAGPLFIHQLSHVWIDFRDIRDEFMRQHDLDYFENSRRATLVQQQYAIRNPRQFEHYGEYCWGVTSSDGPGPNTFMVNGLKRVFYDYIARGAPFGPDDGTLAPWAVVASLPFAPEIVLPTIQNYERMQLNEAGQCDYKASFSPTPNAAET